MTKGDVYTKEIFERILNEGCMDINPRPHYEDEVLVDGRTVTDLLGNVIELNENQGLIKRNNKWYLCTPAHTLSVNHGMCTYDLTKGESPLITLRPIATKSSIGELLWIYQDESNDLDILRKYGVSWWDEWDIGNRTIGSVYGETVRRHKLMKNLLEGLKNNPDGRRHNMDLWQEDDFKEPHGLKPCAYRTDWNVRHGKDGIDYLDMSLKQRSSDFATAGCINQVQYLVLLYLVARHLDLCPGRFTWYYDNIQIYDRHIGLVKDLLSRESIECNPTIKLNPNKKNFYDFTKDDITIEDYPKELIKKKNPQVKFEIAI